MPRITLLSLFLAPALLAQGPCFDTNLGTDLNMFDDDLVQGLSLGFTFTYNGVGYTQVCVESNGSIYLGGSTTAFPDYLPDETQLLTSPDPRIVPLWTDFQADAPGSGHIYFNAVPASGGNPAYALFTWAGVYEYSRTTPIEMQCKLDANSSVTITYGSQGAIGGTLNPDVIIGATPGINAVSNHVSFATLPVVIAQNNFADVRNLPNSPAGFQMNWTPTLPGYVAVNLPCTTNHFPLPARSEPFGRGCPTSTTVYEVFDGFTTFPDLSGLDLTFLPNGVGGYVIIPGIAGPLFTGLTNNVGAGDDTTHPVTLPFTFPHGLSPSSAVSSIYVSSNGFLTLGANDPGPGCCSGDPFALVTGQPCIAGYWADLDPTAAAVYADYDAANGEFVCTWNNVPEYGAPGTSNTFQIALAPTGIIKIRWQSVGLSFHQFLSGYSYGGGVSDQGPTDLSAITSLDSGPLQFGMALRHDAQFGSAPVLGTTFLTDVIDISPAPQGNLAGMIISFAELNPGVDLSFLGAPTCSLYQVPAPDSLQFFQLAGGQQTISFSTPIPVLPFLIGLTVVSQTFSDDATSNAFGWKISNGLRWHLNNF